MKQHLDPHKRTLIKRHYLDIRNASSQPSTAWTRIAKMFSCPEQCNLMSIPCQDALHFCTIQGAMLAFEPKRILGIEKYGKSHELWVFCQELVHVLHRPSIRTVEISNIHHGISFFWLGKIPLHDANWFLDNIVL